MENFVIFYGHVKYITALWYILLPFGNVVVIWYISPRFGILQQEKSGNPGQTECCYFADCTRRAPGVDSSSKGLPSLKRLGTNVIIF
jgi:hypothetical protein